MWRIAWTLSYPWSGFSPPLRSCCGATHRQPDLGHGNANPAFAFGFQHGASYVNSSFRRPCPRMRRHAAVLFESDLLAPLSRHIQGAPAAYFRTARTPLPLRISIFGKPFQCGGKRIHYIYNEYRGNSHIGSKSVLGASVITVLLLENKRQKERNFSLYPPRQFRPADHTPHILRSVILCRQNTGIDRGHVQELAANAVAQAIVLFVFP